MDWVTLIGVSFYRVRSDVDWRNELPDRLLGASQLLVKDKNALPCQGQVFHQLLAWGSGAF